MNYYLVLIIKKEKKELLQNYPFILFKFHAGYKQIKNYRYVYLLAFQEKDIN